MKIKRMIASIIMSSICLMPTNVFGYENYETIIVDGGDLSGYRQANVKVDIGYGNREYWAYTNEYGQLIRIEAKEIIPQYETNGRYYDEIANVPGTEHYDLDRGHVIADSLGGVANAYNITPQDKETNRKGGEQYNMEEQIRNAGGCTNFVATITYENNDTQIPSSYEYTYEINGIEYNREFDNDYEESQEQYSNKEDNTIVEVEDGNIYVAEGNNYYHHDKHCKFLNGLNVKTTNSIGNRTACNCTESWYK